jgi:glutamine synthetase
MFEELNLAVEHNMLIMETLKKVADDHGFVCLLHEKPFAGVNGSGKHNNWSLNSSDGRKFLDPGQNPQENAIFLTFLCAVIQAVDKHADLLRATVATAGNDHRLGANEAPPAIISIYLGEQLNEVIEQIEKGVSQKTKGGGTMNIGIDALPELPRDATDRNRTSPFAFTGNKFEFRAVGSKQSCAGPNIALNTIVAEALDGIATDLEKVSKKDRIKELQKILQKIIKKHKRVIFNGDNYSEAWLKEAKKRGLPNFRTTPEALARLVDKKNVKLLEKYKVLKENELHSRYEIFIEEYEKTVQIEGRVALDLVSTLILPAAMKQQGMLADNILKLQQLNVKAGTEEQKKCLEKIGSLIDKICSSSRLLEKALDKDAPAAIVKEMNAMRSAVDQLEKNVDDELWPLAKYSEMLFIY